MNKMTYAQMVAGLNDLTASELIELNKVLIQVARNKQRSNRFEAAASQIGKWKRGDVISFEKSGRGRHAGLNYFIFEGYNRAGTGLQGPSCNENGVKDPFVTKWTVDVTQPTLKLIMRDGKKV